MKLGNNLAGMVLAAIPGKPATQTGIGDQLHDFSADGLLGVGLGGDNTPRKIAFQLRLEFWACDHSAGEYQAVRQN